MKPTLLSALLGASFLLAPVAYAQTPNVTATCKDGTEFSGATRSGACHGHKGVASWNTAAASASPGIAPAAQPPARSTTAIQTPPPSIPGRTASNSSATAAAKTGGPGQVWVNNASKVYHCPGDRYYGKTKSGEFMSQSAAQAAGDRPSDGKACTS